ncbi:MAG: serine beta-lactamase-like protein LACTB [Planctomycetota bacterium]|jgi:serine beta-lactamase-like protein LACTB
MNAFPPQYYVLGYLLVACLLPLSAQDSPSKSPPRKAASIEARLQAAIKKHGVPGLSCAVVNKGELVFSAGYGFADLENDVPATDATVYRLASISKPVTAVLIMQCAEQGKLDLDADVSELLAGWPKKRWPVTCRQLLAHLSGVRHYKRFEVESTKRYRNQTAALTRFAKDPLLHEPGSKYVYSTFGFNLLAAVVEERFGKNFGEAVQEYIALPASAATLQDDDQRRLIKWRAQGYVMRGNRLQNSKLMDSSYKLGGGGLCASAPDLARFAQALMAGRLLKPETCKAMWTEQRTEAGKPVGYGLGFGVREIRGKRVVQHSGAQSRVSTMLCMLPDEQLAVVIMCNLEGTRLGGVAQQIAFSVSRESARKVGGGKE